MSSRRPVQADRRAAIQLSAALLTCVLALTLTTLNRSHPGQHHTAHAKAVVGVSTSHLQYGVTRSDQHAVTAATSTGGASPEILTSVAHPVALLAARAVDTPRVRGPPGRAA